MLKIHRLGRQIPSPCLLEVKTLRVGPSATATFRPEAQLYFSRRGQLYTARHRAGVFSPSEGEVTMEGADAVRKRLGRWEAQEKTQRALGKLAGLLRLLCARGRVGGLSNEVEGWSVCLVVEGNGEGERGRVKAGLYKAKEGGRVLPGA